MQTQAVLILLQERGRCVYRTFEGHLHQQLDGSPPTQRKQHYQNSKAATFHSIFQRLTYESRALKISDEYLSLLRFADDILIYANKPYDLKRIPTLADESQNQRLTEDEQFEDKSDGKRLTNIYVITT